MREAFDSELPICEGFVLDDRTLAHVDRSETTGLIVRSSVPKVRIYSTVCVMADFKTEVSLGNGISIVYRNVAMVETIGT